MNGELLRLIDSIHRDKRIDKEVIFEGIETALASAVRKHFEMDEIPEIKIDRTTGKIAARSESGPIDPTVLGRITAQTAKQAIIQKIKDAEGDVIFTDMETKTKEILTGSVLRFEHGNIIVTVSKIEAVLPKTEQVPGESYRIGERIKALVISVKKQGAKVKITLSRMHPDFVRRLFEREIPEIADKTVEIKDIVREGGVRTKIAVASSNPKVDATGACVGVRGARIKNIVEELNGEKIDIIQWNDDLPTLIKNAMKPVEVEAVEIDESTKRAKVFVRSDQMSLAIGKKGQNIRLASKLTKWEIDVASIESEEAENNSSEKSPASNQDLKNETEGKADEPAKLTSE
ncbi:MAG: transcription termination factor NusA [Planctomycetota bacterium]